MNTYQMWVQTGDEDPTFAPAHVTTAGNDLEEAIVDFRREVKWPDDFDIHTIIVYDGDWWYRILNGREHFVLTATSTDKNLVLRNQ